MKPSTLWIPLVLLAATLAGCAGDAPSDSGPGPDEIPPDIQVEATDDTGAIRGVVVDEAIRPVTGAKVTVPMPDGSTLESTTGESGAFGFSKVPPGTYFVMVSKLGYFDSQQSVDVVAGVAAPPVTKVMLRVNAAATPYVQELTFAGFVECSTTLLAVCALPNDPGEPIIYTGNVTNDEFIGYFEVDGPPQWVQSEMFWSSTQAISDRMWLWHSYADETGDFSGSFPDPHVTGPSPLLLTHNESQAAEVALGNPNQLVLRVFSGDIEGTSAPDAIDNCYGVPGVACFANGPGFAIQQEFTIFTHLFYNYLPPDGWRFSDNSGVPQPS